MPASINRFFEVYQSELGNRPGLRRGQAAFNTLFRVHPELANRIRGTHNDPFYDDNRLPQFFSFIATAWEEGE